MTPQDDFPQIELKLLFDDLPPIVITFFYLIFILLITILIYLYILIIDNIVQLYKKRSYTLLTTPL
jgi:hypothetical protein